MIQSIVIILVASIIGIGYLIKIRSYDIYEKEPFIKLLIVAIVGGTIAVLSSLAVYGFVNVNRNFVDAVLKIGPIEESSKFFALIIIYYFIKKDFNEIVDGIIYITAISLGFSIIENIFYAFRSDEPFILLFQRSIFSVIGHISFSGYMGIAFYIHKHIRKNFVGILLSIIMASVAHGFYDGVLFHQELNFLFKLVFIGLLILQFRLLRTALGFSSFREKLTDTTFKETNNTIFLVCSKCNSSIKCKELEFHGIKAGICYNCNSLVFNAENIVKLFNYFRPIKRGQIYPKYLPKNQNVIALDSDHKILYSIKRRFLSANVNDLSTWLDETNRNDRLRVFDIPLFGFLLKHLGLKYIQDNPVPTLQITEEI